MNKIISIINEEIQSIINEGLSSVLYHYTYTSNLINILKENKLHASTNIGSLADLKTSYGKFYFFSLQRTKGKTGYAGNTGRNVAIVLDGNKLKNNYRGHPIDYWQYPKSPKNYDSNSAYMSILKSAELEDRIVLDKPSIDNADKYIIEIHIFIDSNTSKKYVSEIIKLTGEKNISTYFYDDFNQYQLQNKNKSINPESITLKNDDSDVDYNSTSTFRIEHLFKMVAPLLLLNNDEENKNKLYKLIDELSNEYNLDNEEINKLKQSIEYNKKNLEKYPDDELYSIYSEIHSNRTNRNTYILKLFLLITNDMKKYNAINIKDYINLKTGHKKNDKQEKPYEILWYNDNNEPIKWNEPVWNYLSPSDFYEALPKYLQNNLNMVGYINNEKITFKEFYKNIIPTTGKSFIKKFFEDNNIIIKKIIPNTYNYNEYLALK